VLDEVENGDGDDTELEGELDVSEALSALAEQQDEESSEEAEPPPRATPSLLKRKKRVRKEVQVTVSDEDGEPLRVSLLFEAVPATRYDKIMAAHPPRPQDKKQGYAYNPDKFGPAIIAATCIDPVLSEEDVKEIWNSEDWNRGERMMLLMSAIEVCTAGLNLPFSSRG